MNRKKVLLVYLPFCTPAGPPYSLAYLASFLKLNSTAKIEVLDLNIEFHKEMFPAFQHYYHDAEQWQDYEEKTGDYMLLTAKTYAENNQKVVRGEKPELFTLMLQKIREKKADIIALSIVYSSQAFYAHAILQELHDVVTVIGGPAVNEKLKALATKTLKNEVELVEFINEQKVEHDRLRTTAVPDFSLFNLGDYFSPQPVIPLRTSTTCFYKLCTFCAHYNKVPYREFPLAEVKEAIVQSGQKSFFFIDDMIPTKRLLELAEMLKSLHVSWMCQLRPTRDLTSIVLQKLHEGGLKVILWGVESGNDRILGLMRKGTNKKDVAGVLQDSHSVGIKNVTYILGGFPSETKEEFLETFAFLEENQENIDLVSVSIFGLHYETPVYNEPEKYGITITEEKRTILDPKITYIVEKGLTAEQAETIKKRHHKMLERINKFPKGMNFFREHMFAFIK